MEFHSDSGHTIVTNESGKTSNASLFAAGHCAGAKDDAGSTLSGRKAGLACALSLSERPELRKQLDELL